MMPGAVVLSGWMRRDPIAFRVVPQRFAAYLAINTTGDRASFGPQDAVVGDAPRPR